VEPALLPSGSKKEGERATASTPSLGSPPRSIVHLVESFPEKVPARLKDADQVA
jgi:hypothetical protein